jgi:NAD(P)-dependent dehydrogenase (short-subunit alcohol dehydrogenase family)
MLANPFRATTAVWNADIYASIDPTRPELRLKGKSIITTNGTSDLGAAIACSCAKAGASRIALIGCRLDTLEGKRADILSHPSSIDDVVVAQADIRNTAEVSQAFRTIRIAFDGGGSGNNRLREVLIHNAACFTSMRSIFKCDVDDWFRSFDRNVKDSLICVKGFLDMKNMDADTLLRSPSRRSSPPPPTVVTISIAATQIQSCFFPGFSAYIASKMASIRLLDYLQSEHPDVHVVSIHTGQILHETVSDRLARMYPVPLDQG